jgi:hypothetical protein
MADIIIEVVPPPVLNTTIEVFTGAPGPAGPAGPGVPVGGTAGQVLAKIDGTNYNTQWVTIDSPIVAALIFG